MGEYMEHEKKLGKWQLRILGEGVLWLPTISFHRPPEEADKVPEPCRGSWPSI